MKNEELDLFPELKITKTYIRREGKWVFIDDVERENFEFYKNHNYRMTIDLNRLKCFGSNSIESSPYIGDRNAKPVTIDEYFKIAQIIRNNGLFYNKKLGKTLQQ